MDFLIFLLLNIRENGNDHPDTFDVASFVNDGNDGGAKHLIAIEYLRDPFLLDHLTLALIHPSKQLSAPQHGRTAKLLAFACGSYFTENPEIGNYCHFNPIFIIIILFADSFYFHFHFHFHL